MREPGLIVGGAGALIGVGIIAYALMFAEFATGPDTSPIGDRLRLILIGFAIATVIMTVGAALRHSQRWATHVFVALGVLLSIVAVWWAVGELLG